MGSRFLLHLLPSSVCCIDPLKRPLQVGGMECLAEFQHLKGRALLEDYEGPVNRLRSSKATRRFAQSSWLL